MAYDGTVVPGGGSAVRGLDQLTIRKLSVGLMDNNAYLLTCVTSAEQLLVDAAAEPERLLALLREGSGSAALATVVTTHRHHDHIGALESIVAITGAAVVCGAPDADALNVPVSRRLLHGDVLTVGEVQLEVIAVRGHTPGSVVLAYREPHHVSSPDGAPDRVHLFTGDSLFPGGPGRTSDPDDFRSLMDDLEERVFDRFGDQTWVYPGHGHDTTLGVERPSLATWRARGW